MISPLRRRGSPPHRVGSLSVSIKAIATSFVLKFKTLSVQTNRNPSIMPSIRSKPPAGGRGNGHAHPKEKPAASATSVAAPNPTIPPPADPEIPEGLKCPISFDLMRDPVICSTGHTYERESLLGHFRAQEHAGNLPTCPISGLKTTRESVQPNWAMRGELDRLLAAHPHWTPADWSDRKLAPAVAGGGVADQNVVSVGQVAAGEFNDFSSLKRILLFLPGVLFGIFVFLYRLELSYSVVAWCHLVRCSTSTASSSFPKCMEGFRFRPATQKQTEHYNIRFFGTRDIALLTRARHRSSYDRRSISGFSVHDSENGISEMYISHYFRSNTTFCSRSDSAISAPFRPPNLSDVPNMLFNDDHWIRRFLDQRHERIHRAVRDVVEAGRLAKKNRARRHMTSATAALDAVKLRRARNFIPSPIFFLPISRPYCYRPLQHLEQHCRDLSPSLSAFLPPSPQSPTDEIKLTFPTSNHR